MIQFKSEEEIEIIKESALILGKAHGEVAKHVKEGVKTSFLDKIAEEYIRDNKAIPSFKGYNGFPASLCISVNEVVVHGFPSQYQLKDGDIISIDCGVFHQGFHSDSAYTYPVGEVSPKTIALLKATKESLYLGIEKAVFGNRVGDIGNAIQKFVEAKGYTVVRELVGHGVGKQLHESPEVPNWGKRGSGAKLKAGMVIAIEPMVNLGTRNVVQERDGWTIRTADRKPSAHYEHTVAILEDRTEILTTHRFIEENYKF
ncbi:type I methionyl aminopeptidase [Cyclobacterium marinum]|uniref:Methionine aminopeptidase n=1 Tax=Cyclobacterium marinum (strain ATCC 25205 / DSM 745 / LMG 13164 / NCIMB 1802) TaxID=880070 RepID=G0IXC4_CYCMS|nr:type I methionyl aminopeptidase [Cyclobacterium marinum]AEL26349.1 methionine aminopeptidase, type I [Cyclobacterium marinum DSM 745]MBR9775007.1 type I methionyl aminopeptidase [Cytophagales bacterium]|tara:strand:+ start:6759 stop:7532 length:774 start_codon:yes stop_codon:yes gene_type:complete